MNVPRFVEAINRILDLERRVSQLEQPAEDAPSGEPPKCDFCNRPRSDLVNVEAVMCSDCEKKWDKMREAGAKEGGVCR